MLIENNVYYVIYLKKINFSDFIFSTLKVIVIKEARCSNPKGDDFISIDFTFIACINIKYGAQY